MRRTGRRLRWALIVGAILLAWPFVAWLAALSLITNVSLERADAIVVLSGSAVYKERARYAGKLYNEGRAPRVILTNDNMRGPWSQERQTNPFFIERARDELLAAGVPNEAVYVLPGIVESTFDEVLAAHTYATQNKLRSLLFVTSAYHTRRTLWTLNKIFQQSGIVVGVESAQPGDQTPRPGTWWLHLRGWRSVALEYAKLVYYYWEYR
jgi:uncharacterized SAM-binding protein YcdF (DUF218 family)